MTVHIWTWRPHYLPGTVVEAIDHPAVDRLLGKELVVKSAYNILGQSAPMYEFENSTMRASEHFLTKVRDAPVLKRAKNIKTTKTKAKKHKLNS